MLLLDQPTIKFFKTSAIHPANLLPDDNSVGPLHDGMGVTNMVQFIRPEQTDAPLQKAKEVLYTDRNSFIQDGIRYARLQLSPWTGQCGPSLSAKGHQHKALRSWHHPRCFTRGGQSCCWVHSRHAFAIARVHSALYREWALLTLVGKEIKNKEEMLTLLEVPWLPREVALAHC